MYSNLNAFGGNDQRIDKMEEEQYSLIDLSDLRLSNSIPPWQARLESLIVFMLFFGCLAILISEVMTKLRSSSVELRLIYIKADVNDYDEDIKLMSNFTKEEFVQILHRQSTRFARGSSNFRGVTLHKCGRWEACIGQLLGKKEYDQAAIKCHGREVITNFNPSLYDGELVIEASNAVRTLFQDLQQL